MPPTILTSALKWCSLCLRLKPSQCTSVPSRPGCADKTRVGAKQRWTQQQVAQHRTEGRAGELATSAYARLPLGGIAGGC